MHLKVFCAFAGYDSQCLALDRLSRDFPDFSYTLVGWSEIDKYAIQAHNALYPDAASLNLGDISKIDWDDPAAPDFDLATWSFPCQSISVAGQQKGLRAGSGTTSSLAYEALKCFEIKRPRFLLMENVKALLQKKFAQEWTDIQRRLSAMGYVNFFQVMDSKDYGVPQHRERVFMVSVLASPGLCPQYVFPEPFPLERRLKHVLEPYGTVPESYYLPEEKVAKLLASMIEGKKNRKPRLVPLLDLPGLEPSQPEPPQDTDRIIQIGNVTEGTKRENPNTGRVYLIDGIAPTINTMAGGNREPLILEQTDRVMQVGNVMDDTKRSFKNPERGRVFDSAGVCPTLKASMSDRYILEPTSCAIRTRSYCGQPAAIEIGDDVANCLTSVGKDSMVLEPLALSYSRSSKCEEDGKYHTRRHFSDVVNTLCPGRRESNEVLIAEPVSSIAYIYRIRKLTPRECFRLMDVDDDRIDQIQAAGISKSQQYKLAGNSIVVSCLYHIFRKMFVHTDAPKTQPTQLTIFDI